MMSEILWIRSSNAVARIIVGQIDLGDVERFERRPIAHATSNQAPRLPQALLPAVVNRESLGVPTIFGSILPQPVALLDGRQDIRLFERIMFGETKDNHGLTQNRWGIKDGSSP